MVDSIYKGLSQRSSPILSDVQTLLDHSSAGLDGIPFHLTPSWCAHPLEEAFSLPLEKPAAVSKAYSLLSKVCEELVQVII